MYPSYSTKQTIYKPPNYTAANTVGTSNFNKISKQHPLILNNCRLYPSQQSYSISSQYRVHFSLLNVYYPIQQYQTKSQQISYEMFLTKLKEYFLVKYIVKIQIVQITQIVDDNHVDLSIALHNDIQAIKFLNSHQFVQIQTQRGPKQCKIIIGSNFKTFMNNMKKIMPQLYVPIEKPYKHLQSLYKPQKSHQQACLQKKPYQQVRKDSSSNSSSSSEQNVSYQKRQPYQLISYDDQQKFVNVIWVFSVPLEFGEKDVDYKLKEKKIMSIYGKSKWKMVQDMEFLQVYLEQPIHVSLLQSVQIKIHKYPCILMPRLSHQSLIYSNLSQYQCQLILPFSSSEMICQQNQQNLLLILQQINGLITVIKDDYYGEEKYIVLFCNKKKIQQFRIKCNQLWGQSQVSQAKMPIRVCRMERNFSVNQHLLNNTNETKNQLNPLNAQPNQPNYYKLTYY